MSLNFDYLLMLSAGITPEDTGEPEKQQPENTLLNSILHHEQYSVISYDPVSKKVTPNFLCREKLLKYPAMPDDASCSLAQLKEMLHPTQLREIEKLEDKMHRLMEELPVEKKKQFQLIFPRLFVSSRETYICLILKVWVEVDDTGKVTLVFIRSHRQPALDNEKMEFYENYTLYPYGLKSRKDSYLNGTEELLTNMEMTVARLLAHGLSCKEIKKQLHVSLSTVESHCDSIRSKLQLKYIRHLHFILPHENDEAISTLIKSYLIK